MLLIEEWALVAMVAGGTVAYALDQMYRMCDDGRELSSSRARDDISK